VRIAEYGVGSMECGVWSHNKQAEVLEKCCQLLGTKSHRPLAMLAAICPINATPSGQRTFAQRTVGQGLTANKLANKLPSQCAPTLQQSQRLQHAAD